MQRTTGLPALLLLGWLAAAPAAAVDAGGDVTVARDLLAVLELRAKSCGAIASHERLGEGDYRVRCSNGKRYRIYVQGERVVVEEES